MPGVSPAQFFGSPAGNAPTPPAGMPMNAPTGVQSPQGSGGVSVQDFMAGNTGTQTPAPQAAPSVGGFIGNAVGSVGNLIGGVGNAIAHPIQTVENLGGAAVGAGEQALNTVAGTNFNNAQTQSASNLENFYNQRYGISDLLSGNIQGAVQKIANTAYTDPAGMAADLSILLGGAGAVAGKIGEAGEAGAAADAVSAGDTIAMGGKTAEGASVATPGMTTASKVGSALSNAGEAINPLNIITKPIGAVVNSAIPNIVKGATSQFTGLQPEDISRIMDNPSAFTSDAINNYTREGTAAKIDSALQQQESALSEEGKGYADIRANTTPVDVTPNYLTKLIADKTGLSVTGSGTAIDPYRLEAGADTQLSPSDASKLQRNILDKWNPQFAKGQLSPAQFLNLRSDLGKVANFDEGIGKSATLDNVAKQMYGQLNTDLRPQVAGLEEKDAAFGAKASAFKDSRAGLLDKNNQLTNGAVNKIANATGKGKAALRAQLEAISPGITDEILNGSTIEHIQALKGNVVGTYGRTGGMIGGAVAGAGVLGPAGAVAGGLIEQFLTRPETVIPVLRVLGKTSPVYQAILSHFNVATPALVAAQIGKLSKASQTPAKRIINISR